MCRLCLLAVLLLLGCGLPPAAQQDAPARPSAAPRTLSIYNWDTYIDPALLQEFERREGVRVRYETYGSNEELLERVRKGGHGIDIVVPSDYAVTYMRQRGLLAPLSKDAIPNLMHLEPAFLNPVFDPGNRYCVPYQWGSVGVGYNSRTAPRVPESWRIFFESAGPGRIALLDEPRIALGVALLALGYSPNTSDERELGEAAALLKRHARQIGGYLPDTGQDALAEGQVDMALEYNGDIVQLMRHDGAMRYVIPAEGSLIWTDSMCVLASSSEQDLAARFINFLLEPQIGAALPNSIHYSTPNRAALPFLERADRQNQALYPPLSTRRRLFYLVDVGPHATARYEAAWADVREHYAKMPATRP
jgi:spermidine/putrescine transport system substrate-binding protein